MFNEICIYEAKIDKQDEIEALMKEIRRPMPTLHFTFLLPWQDRESSLSLGLG